jgi:hypothetical protein
VFESLAQTDASGGYRLEIPAGRYYIAVGSVNAPTYYPDTASIASAKAISIAAGSTVESVDFSRYTAAVPSPLGGIAVLPPALRISANSGRPLSGFALNLIKANSGAVSRMSSFLPARRYRPITTAGDGTYEIPEVAPGQYALQALISGASPLTKTVEVADAAVNIDFDFSINVLSGRIVWEDGSPFSDPAIGPVALSTISNPNFISTTLMSVSNDGAFSSVIDPGDYRFYIRSLPAGYVVRTMMIGSVDLSKDPLHVTADVPNTVEIRLAKGLYPGTRVHGRILDAATGAPPAADFLELCCFTTGPFERLSAAILPDGSFNFPKVPPGSYTADLRKNSAQAVAGVLNRTIEIGDQESSGMLLVSATQLSSVTATVTFEDGSNLPSNVTVTVALLVTPGTPLGTNPPNSATATKATSIPMGNLRDGTFWTPFPTGVLYTISVEHLPDGYRIKSMSGPGATSAVPRASADGGISYSGYAPGVVSIVIQRTPAQ